MKASATPTGDHHDTFDAFTNSSVLAARLGIGALIPGLVLTFGLAAAALAIQRGSGIAGLRAARCRWF